MRMQHWRLYTLNGTSRLATQGTNLSQRRAKHQKTGREQIGATKMGIRTFWMRSIVIDTRAALANFQRDYGLEITGAIDEATVETLGLYQTDSQESGPQETDSQF